jgi:hypothetical protein
MLQSPRGKGNNKKRGENALNHADKDGSRALSLKLLQSDTEEMSTPVKIKNDPKMSSDNFRYVYIYTHILI